MLEVHALFFDYQDKPLLHEIEFSLSAGQLLHLQGANGSGKTTLLKLLAGLLQPHEGLIHYDGKAICSNQSNVCYVGHKAGLNPMLTIKENCFFDMHWGRRPNLSLATLVAGFGLKGLEEEPCYLLSAGQQRRVSLLRIAMTDAKLWLLDEPLIALDSNAIQTLMSCIEDHLSQGGQVVLTSHQTLPFNQSYQVFTL